MAKTESRLFSTFLVVFFGIIGCVLSLLTGMGIPHAVAEWWALLGIGASACVCLWLLSRRVPGGHYFRLPLMASFGICFLVGVALEIASFIVGDLPNGAVFIVAIVALVVWWAVALRRLVQIRRDDGNYW